MFVIMVYDMGVKRVAKALKMGRKFLTHVQNSVFEGEITDANYKKLKTQMDKLMVKNEDSIIFYTFRTTRYSQRECLGMEKGRTDFII